MHEGLHAWGVGVDVGEGHTCMHGVWGWMWGRVIPAFWGVGVDVGEGRRQRSEQRQQGLKRLEMAGII